MMDRVFISIDIGSTYTKGALFSLPLASDRFFLKKQALHPTTVDLPMRGVQYVLNALQAPIDTPIYYSSSAKGGLSVVAIGIVPELTLYMAKLTAYSAGGKIVKVFDFKLSLSDIQLIDELRPDIILFAGGTDGGNERYNLHNAKLLQSLTCETTILYAGNRAIADEIAILLKDKPLEIAPNILPSIDSPFPEAAREKIREIFLKRIVECKGLQDIRDLVGRDPYPTPYSVFELIQKIPIYRVDWDSFCLVDMGGATTDFYSYDHETHEAGIVYKGIQEPDEKRTVEGDLGMRVSAASTFAAGRYYLEKVYSTEALDRFELYVKKITAYTDFLPTEAEEIDFDHALARICLGLSALRHAGTRRKIFTANGESFLQQGKNLLSVQKIIGTGGFLSNSEHFHVDPHLLTSFKQATDDVIELLPQTIRYYVDINYVIPLLANLSHDYPKESVNSAIDAIQLATLTGNPS